MRRTHERPGEHDREHRLRRLDDVRERDAHLTECAARRDVAHRVEERHGDDGDVEGGGHLGQRLQAEQPHDAHEEHAARELQRGHEPREREEVQRRLVVQVEDDVEHVPATRVLAGVMG